MEPVQNSNFTQNNSFTQNLRNGFLEKVNIKKYIFPFLAIIFFMVFWQWISSPMIVTVVGIGEVNVPATNAAISFNISAIDSSSPQGAISSVSARADAIRRILIDFGIDEKDITQSQVYTLPAKFVTAGAMGFQASIAMSVKTTQVSKISDLVASLYANGVGMVSQPVLSVENKQALNMQAYESAIKDAKKKAAKIGNKNWKFIRKIIMINSQSSGTTSTSTTNADASDQTETNGVPQNGVFKIIEAVSISYKMW